MSGGPRSTPSRESRLFNNLIADIGAIRHFAQDMDIPEDEARDHIDGFVYAMHALCGDAPIGRTLPQWLQSKPKEIKVNWQKEGF